MEFQLIKSAQELDESEAPIIKPPHVVIFYWYDGKFRNVIRHFAPNQNLRHNQVKKLQELYQPQDDYCGLTKEQVFSVFLEKFNGQQGWYLADLKAKQYFFFSEHEQFKNKLTELSST
ncbi:hypothetical protein B4U84_06040 [Westiellopsis prolifica IICB1]|nr:hypothetical protein B4U84_06040 [Westiellopsis prolifica IICB1]